MPCNFIQKHCFWKKNQDENKYVVKGLVDLFAGEGTLTIDAYNIKLDGFIYAVELEHDKCQIIINKLTEFKNNKESNTKRELKRITNNSDKKKCG